MVTPSQERSRAVVGANLRGVLSDSAGEDDGIDTGRRRGHAGDLRAQPVQVDPHGQSGVRVALAPSRQKFVHVAAAPAGQAEQAGVVFEGVLDRRGGQPVAQGPQQGAGVDVAAAGGHHQTLERREAHGGVDRTTAGDGGDRRPAAEVADDQAELGDRPAEQLVGAAGWPRRS